jgi:hypothetical protein
MPSISKVFSVKLKSNFYEEKQEYTKHFLEEDEAYNYMMKLTDTIYKIPTLVIIEEGIAVVDNTNVFVLECITL